MSHADRRIQKALLAVILAGGRGTRLGVLTEKRCKPELPFGKNRFIDFALSNVVNSNVAHTMILTQYMQQGLTVHIRKLNLNAPLWGKTVEVVPAQQRLGDESWYVGNANAVYQNHEAIRDNPADTVVILAADHIYKLDIRQLHTYHQDKCAQFTVCGMSMKSEEAAGNFGVMELDANNKIIGFEEKPKTPKIIPGREGISFGSMGIYMVEKQLLLEVLSEDHDDPLSEHDFGKNIIPKLIEKQSAIFAYDYKDNMIPGEIKIVNGVDIQQHYWRDVGRIDSYWQSLMDLVAVSPILNLYNKEWPVPTMWDMLPQAKFIFPNRERYQAEFKDHPYPFLPDMITSGGCVFDSPRNLYKAIFGRSGRTGYGADIAKSIIFDDVIIGDRVRLIHTIVEEGVRVPDGARVGYDEAEDIANGVIIDKDHDPNADNPAIRIITKDSHFRRLAPQVK